MMKKKIPICLIMRFEKQEQVVLSKMVFAIEEGKIADYIPLK